MGCVGLRVHGIRNLLLSVCLFGLNASKDKTDQKEKYQIRNKGRIEKVSVHELNLAGRS